MGVFIMARNLVIVESPAKAKSIGKILGKNYKVLASIGHVRDLPKSSLGIDIENDLEPKYINIRGKGPIINELKKEAKKSQKVFLATDPDREGEAISWHLAHILDIPASQDVRVEFNEITSDAIKKAIKKPRQIDNYLVDAQQARRVLDRLVGYQISPLLWKKIRRGLSAGRVQSVATKLICDREKEINDFVPEEYWSIQSIFKKDSIEFTGNFIGKHEKDKEIKIELKNQDDVRNILSNLDKNKFVVSDIKKGKKNRRPYPPYTTSTLQQDASKRLGFNTKKTMSIAQQLYEGIEIGKEGSIGLITYMRTDSTRISNEATNEAKSFIIDKYGKEYSNGGVLYEKKGKKETQDAHECIRPTLQLREPIDLEHILTKDQFRLYKLIWDRFLASQMSLAKYDTQSINILCKEYIFRASGSILIFDGFLKVYKGDEEGNKDSLIPKLSVNESLNVTDIVSKQHFTQGPPRYTEASLIKTLEELGIGRPSTYSPTIGTILAREYVNLDKRTFYPTELGILVNDLLTEHFKEIVNEKFTAELENSLDDIAEGKINWKKIIKEFYANFSQILLKAEEKIDKIEIEDEVTEEICQLCGKNMVIKNGRFGKFLACPGYPECKNTKPIIDKINVKCPLCNGDIIKRKSKKGRIFFGCSNFPDCKFVSWNEPVNEKCPKCNEFMYKKTTKNETKINCSNKECGYSRKEGS